MQFFGINESKIQRADLEIKFIKGKNFNENWDTKSKIRHEYSGKNHKNRGKNLQFFGINESKIRRTDLEIKFIKGKKFKENWDAQNQKFGFLCLMKFFSRFVHWIFDCFTPKNCKFFSLFL